MKSKNCIGIRREDKNEWERRVPLSPSDVNTLVRENGLRVLIQPSSIRTFTNDEYHNAGAEIFEDLSQCGVVFAVKEIPMHLVRPGTAYVFFSHTIKGQSHNMPLLKKIMDAGSTLIDYERIVDEKNKRVVAFGEHAGLAGMIDSLWAYGQRLAWEGIESPFAKILQSHRYENLEAALNTIADVGSEIRAGGLPQALSPLVVGITGYGNVSRGAQRILKRLPVMEIKPNEIAALVEGGQARRDVIYKVVFREEHTVEPVTQGKEFDLDDYYARPEGYRSKFNSYIPYLSMLANCVYWNSKYPRIVTKNDMKKLFAGNHNPRLRVIGDISCDIDGGIEFTVKATDQINPVFVYEPMTDEFKDGFAGNGPVVLAVDNLPCELPKEASSDFSKTLKRFVPSIAAADLAGEFDELKLHAEIKRAVVVHRGKLTPDYRYLEGHIAGNI